MKIEGNRTVFFNNLKYFIKIKKEVAIFLIAL